MKVGSGYLHSVMIRALRASQVVRVPETDERTVGCCEKEHPYSQFRLTRLTVIANGVALG